MSLYYKVSDRDGRFGDDSNRKHSSDKNRNFRIIVEKAREHNTQWGQKRFVCRNQHNGIDNGKMSDLE